VFFLANPLLCSRRGGREKKERIFFMENQQDQIVFEDTNEQYGFTQSPNVVLTSTVLNPTEKIVYEILRRYATMPGGAHPGAATICLEANISDATYKRAIKTFVRSSSNPKPKIPLITAVRRPNQTNKFYVHKITPELIDLLKPAIAMSKQEREQHRKAFNRRKKSKSGAQNEPSIENTGKAQNEPTPQNTKSRVQNEPSIENTGKAQNEPQTILSIKKQTNKQTNKEDCLIDFPSKEVEQKTMAFIQYAFQNGMHVQSVQATKKRYAEALAKGIAHEDLMKALEDSFKLFGANTVPISVITTVIANHEVAEQAKKAAAEEEEKKKKALKENENFLVRNLRAAGLSDREIEIALKGGK
jgi:hypothetical protein